MRYVLHARWFLLEASDQIGLNTVSYLSHGGKESEQALSRKATGASYLSLYAATGSHNSVDSEDELEKGGSHCQTSRRHFRPCMPMVSRTAYRARRPLHLYITRHTSSPSTRQGGGRYDPSETNRAGHNPVKPSFELKMSPRSIAGQNTNSYLTLGLRLQVRFQYTATNCCCFCCCHCCCGCGESTKPQSLSQWVDQYLRFSKPSRLYPWE